MNSKAMYKLSYGLFVLTTQQAGKDNGCIINTAIQAASDPNTITIAVNKANFTHDLLLQSRKFNISMISREADFSLFQRFGFQSGRDTDKFEGFEGSVERAKNGLYVVKKGTNAFLSAEVQQSVDLGSHTLFIAYPTDMDVLSDAPSCTYEYYQSSVKPKPRPSAAAPTGQTVWRCTVCGYEYVGEELPADFICPLCKHPASDFEKIVR